MIEEARGRIDYDECGEGPTVVLVPGSCSTGAAWRPVIAAWNGAFRCVTTSLLGYGATAERRTDGDPSITHEADIVESVVRKAGEACEVQLRHLPEGAIVLEFAAAAQQLGGRRLDDGEACEAHLPAQRDRQRHQAAE